MTKSLPPKTMAEYAAEAAKRNAEVRRALGGFACPHCGCKHLEAPSTWRSRAGKRRRLVCRNCRREVYSLETIDPPREPS